MVESAIFWMFAVVSVAAALGAILSRSTIYAALCLIAVFLSIAGFFLLNNADFLAIAQMLIYAVGLTIIMLFAIMFTGDKPVIGPRGSKIAGAVYAIVLVYVFALLVRGVAGAFLGQGQVPAASPQMASTLAAEGSTALLGMMLFKTYALPFEVASVLLLVAMIGAIVIAKKRFVESEDELLGETRLPVDLASAPTEQAIAALRAKRLPDSSSEPASELSESASQSAVAVLTQEGEQ